MGPLFLSFVYSVMLINTLFCLFDLITRLYVSECFINKLFKLFLCDHFFKGKQFIQSKGFKLHVLASTITGQFLSILFIIMQHRHIFIFNFKTIIRVFRLLSLQVL